MKNSKEIISFDAFSFTYDESGSFGVHNINLTIQEGEFIILTGPSGCGKTTLTRCMNGLIPDFFEGKLSGNCRICGMDILQHETGDYSAYVGSVFQDPRSQFFTLHVKTELPFPSENLGIPMREIQKRLNGTVKDLHIERLLQKSIFQLSSGEKQKVAVASVYTAGVNVYVLDEPSANLDWIGTEQLRQLLKQLKEQGCTIIVSEHKLYYLRELADRMVFLQNGRIHKILDNSEIIHCSNEWLRANGLRNLDLKQIAHTSVVIPQSDHTPVSIRAENLSFKYPQEPLLWRDVSFSAEGGDIIGIVGKNGTGKSTLIRVLMGLEEPQCGKISLCGKYASRQQRRKKSFYVMQDVDYQFFAGSVLEEMLSGHEKEADVLEKAREILKNFHLEKYEDVHPSTLSGGQKQRLSIALSCMCSMSFLYFDEPTSGLDAENMQLVRKTIIEQAGKGCISFVITHDYEFAAALFTSLLIVQDDHHIKRIAPEQYHPSILSKLFELEEI